MCGTLAALVLTVHHRGQWARVLPRFSQLSLLCVAALLVAGVAGAVLTLHSPAQLYAAGYGRVLSAKVVVTAALIVLAWRNRTHWLPAASSHRATAVLSRSRSMIQLAIMAVALTLAAALAVTGYRDIRPGMMGTTAGYNHSRRSRAGRETAKEQPDGRRAGSTRRNA